MTSEESTYPQAPIIKTEQKRFFSELDTLLRSLDRFFSLENLPIAKDDLLMRNFHDELIAVRDVIFRILGILEVIIPENRKNAYWFQRFTESKFLTDYSMDAFRERLYKLDTPEKGLYILYDLFINLKSIVTDLLKAGNISYQSYTNIGQLMSKEIRGNHFFNPFKKEINPEFDVIANPVISDIVRSLPDRDMKKNLSLLYLYLFRFLRYLDHVNTSSQDTVNLHASLLILIMLRSEIHMLHAFIKGTVDHCEDEELQVLLKSLSFQFSMETKRVYLQELREVLMKRDPHQFRGKIENSLGMLKNLIEQSIVQLSQFFKPDIHGPDIFISFTTRLHQSLQLREDLSVLHRFLSLLEGRTGLSEEQFRIFEAMKQFMKYFESSTSKLLRYNDYDEFSTFFYTVSFVKDSDFHNILEKIHNFRIFLETTLQHLENRAELRDVPLKTGRITQVLKQYLESGG
jgi:hypothetical protein